MSSEGAFQQASMDAAGARGSLVRALTACNVFAQQATAALPKRVLAQKVDDPLHKHHDGHKPDSIGDPNAAAQQPIGESEDSLLCHPSLASAGARAH